MTQTTDSWVPSWAMITAKLLELRRRRGLMIVVLLFTIGLPVIVEGIRILLHGVDPGTFGPAGTPDTYTALVGTMAGFGFIVAATLGATAGTADLTDGVFRNLVVTGRSRLAIYLARIPAGLAIVLASVAVGYTVLCLVTGLLGPPAQSTLNENGVAVPLNLSEAQLKTWLLEHPLQLAQAFGTGPVVQGIGPGGTPGGGATGSVGTSGGVGTTGAGAVPAIRSAINRNIGQIYAIYAVDSASVQGPPDNGMVKVGLWLLLELTVGFTVGLGLGSLIGQRTISTIVLIVLQIIITPIAVGVAIPHFVNGQRVIVGVAMEQLRPAAIGGVIGRNGGGGHVFGGRGLSIPPMPTWAMVTVIAAWIVGWTIIGARRMVTRDA